MEQTGYVYRLTILFAQTQSGQTNVVHRTWFAIAELNWSSAETMLSPSFSDFSPKHVGFRHPRAAVSGTCELPEGAAAA